MLWSEWGERGRLLAWCPLAVFETAFNPHPEPLALALVVAAGGFARKSRSLTARRRESFCPAHPAFPALAARPACLSGRRDRGSRSTRTFLDSRQHRRLGRTASDGQQPGVQLQRVRRDRSSELAPTGAGNLRGRICRGLDRMPHPLGKVVRQRHLRGTRAEGIAGLHRRARRGHERPGPASQTCGAAFNRALCPSGFPLPASPGSPRKLSGRSRISPGPFPPPCRRGFGRRLRRAAGLTARGERGPGGRRSEERSEQEEADGQFPHDCFGFGLKMPR